MKLAKRMESAQYLWKFRFYMITSSVVMFRFVPEHNYNIFVTTKVIVWAMQEVEKTSSIWSTAGLDIETDNLSQQNWANIFERVRALIYNLSCENC